MKARTARKVGVKQAERATFMSQKVQKKDPAKRQGVSNAVHDNFNISPTLSASHKFLRNKRSLFQ